MMILAKKALEYKTGEAISGDVSVLDKFADKDNISAYAKESLAAMVQAGLVNGTGNNIEPKANTTRAQAAVVMSKIYEEVK
jgi:lactocepin